MNTMYFIVHEKWGIPICSATTLQRVLELLNEYMGIGVDPTSKYIMFEPNNDEVNQGSYYYENEYGSHRFIMYCMPTDELHY